MISPTRALFVTDLDGTLLAPNREIPARNLAAIRTARAAGVLTAVATGRRRSTVVREYAKLDGLEFRVATSNGAVVLHRDNWTPEIIHDISWSVVDELIASATTRGGRVLCMVVPAADQLHDCFVVDATSGGFGSSETPYRAETIAAVDAAVARRSTLVHIAVHWSDHEAALDFVAAASSRLPSTVSAHVVPSPVGEGALAGIVPRGGKGVALVHLARTLNIPIANTAGIGDELNDADLLSAATHRFAVGGSTLARSRPDAVEVGVAASGAVADALGRFVATLDASR